MKKLSIVIPAYNEEMRLPATLDAVVRYGRNCECGTELIVVDDGSRDGTRDIVCAMARSHPYIRLVANPGNRGKGYAVRNGMLTATGDWILSTDADLSTPIEEVDTLAASATKAGAAVAIGSRALDRSLVGVHQSAFREYAGRAFNVVVRVVTGLPFADTQCGFKLYRREAAQEIFIRQQLDGFSFDVEDLYIAKTLGIRVVEVPVRWNNIEGTKVDLLDGLASFTDLIRIRRFAAAGRYR